MPVFGQKKDVGSAKISCCDAIVPPLCRINNVFEVNFKLNIYKAGIGEIDVEVLTTQQHHLVR